MDESNTVHGSNEIFSLIHQCDFKQEEDIGKINKWLHASATKCLGLSLLGKLLLQSQSRTILNHSVSWINCVSQIVALKYEDVTLRKLAAKILCILLKRAHLIPEVARDVSAKCIHSVIESLMLSNFLDPVPSLKCLKAVLKYFPGPCGNFRGKLTRFLLPFALSVNSYTQCLAVRCWCYIPQLGGGGIGRKVHGLQWEKQCSETIDALTFVIEKLLDYNHDLFDPCTTSLTLPFEKLPECEPECTYSLIRRFIALCKCLRELLAVDDLPVVINVPVQQILQILIICFDITPTTLGYTSEKLVCAGFLTNVHQNCLDVLTSLIKRCNQRVSRFASTINVIFDKLLTLWNGSKPDSTVSHNLLRLSVFAAATEWIQRYGRKSRFLCGQCSYEQTTLQHLIKDISSLDEDIQAMDIVPKRRYICDGAGKNKRRKIDSDQLNCSNGKIFYNKTNSALCSQAMIVARLCVYTFGNHLSVNVHASLQRVVLKLLLKLQGETTIMPCYKHTTSRIELYHLLLALTVSNIESTPPPLSLVAGIFEYGATHDRALEVQTFCLEAGVAISKRPAAPHRCFVHFERSQVTNQDNMEFKGSDSNSTAVEYVVDMGKGMVKASDTNLVESMNENHENEQTKRLPISETVIHENDSNSTAVECVVDMGKGMVKASDTNLVESMDENHENEQTKRLPISETVIHENGLSVTNDENERNKEVISLNHGLGDNGSDGKNIENKKECSADVLQMLEDFVDVGPDEENVLITSASNLIVQ